MRLIIYDDLRLVKGIPYSRMQLWRLEKQNKFPKRVPISSQRFGYAEHEIDAWIQARIAARDAATAGTLAVA